MYRLEYSANNDSSSTINNNKGKKKRLFPMRNWTSRSRLFASTHKNDCQFMLFNEDHELLPSSSSAAAAELFAGGNCTSGGDHNDKRKAVAQELVEEINRARVHELYASYLASSQNHPDGAGAGGGEEKSGNNGSHPTSSSGGDDDDDGDDDDRCALRKLADMKHARSEKSIRTNRAYWRWSATCPKTVHQHQSQEEKQAEEERREDDDNKDDEKNDDDEDDLRGMASF